MLLLVCVVIASNIYESGCVFFFQAEDGIRDLVRSRGLGDVYKRQGEACPRCGSYRSQLIDGAQIRVQELEVS